jgi:hypothetical protein
VVQHYKTLGDVHELSGGALGNIDQDPLLTYYNRPGPAFDLPEPVMISMFRGLDDDLDGFEILASTSTGVVRGPGFSNDIEGQLFRFQRDGASYARSGPFPWQGTTNGGRPSHMPQDTDLIRSEVGELDGYTFYDADRGTADGYNAPGFNVFEFHHWNNPYSGAYRQRQFWGRLQPHTINPHPRAAAVGYTQRWESWRQDGEAGWFGGSDKTYSAPYNFVVPWDTRFAKISVFRGRTHRKNFFSWGTYNGCHFWKVVEEQVIDTGTGAVVATSKWSTPIWQADADGSPPGGGLFG